MNKYLKFEYWNTCDLGNIYYQGGQHFIFYLDADVGEPIHEEVEEGQENGDGDFIPTYRRQMKRYRIRTGLIPDYLIDAIQRMKLHDNIELTFKSGEIEQIYNVDCEAEWQFEKYAWQGTVTLTFDMDESITVGACCDNLTVEAEPPGPVDLGGYYVATTGSDDTGDGSFLNPWATWHFGFNQLTAGDTLYIRGGTYTPSATYKDPRYFGVVVDSVAGTAGNKITVLNYPGEVPVLDCRNIVNDARRVGIGLYDCDHWILRGLNVTRVDQHSTGDLSIGVLLYGCDNILVDECNMYNNQGMGLNVSTGSSNILILNCDAYENHDPYSSYGNADGFGSNDNTYQASIIFRGCRSWNNSDDGFDFYNDDALVTIDRCWAWQNGYREDHATPGGDGSGFKLGITSDYPTVLLRVIQNSLTFFNRRAGINSNSANCLINIYNNTIYANGLHGIWMFTADLAYIFRNNVSFGNVSGYDYLSSTQVNYIKDHNSYDPEWQPAGVVVTDADFVSITPTGVDGARQTDGSLPVITFLHLAADSDLRAAGVAIAGLTTDGDGEDWEDPPSIGAFEY